MLRRIRERYQASDRALAQDAELFLIRAASPKALASAAAELAKAAQGWDYWEFVLAARESACNSRRGGSCSAAVVASSTGELMASLAQLAFDIRLGVEPRGEGVFTGQTQDHSGIAVLFSGTAVPPCQGNDLWSDRFVESRRIKDEIAELAGSTGCSPSLSVRAVAAEFAGWKLLERCNISPCTAMGSGAGELLAFAAAGVVDEDDVLPLAAKMSSESNLCMALQQSAFDDPALPVVSSVTGDVVRDGGRAKDLLVQQFSASARPDQALAAIKADLLIDLSCNGEFVDGALAQGRTAIAVKPHGGSVRGLLSAIGAAFAAGAPVNAAALYEDRQIGQARSNTHHLLPTNRFVGEDHQSRV